MPQAITLTLHAKKRLTERFPGNEQQIIERCAIAYQKVHCFVGKSFYQIRCGNVVIVMAGANLITAYLYKTHQPAGI